MCVRSLEDKKLLSYGVHEYQKNKRLNVVGICRVSWYTHPSTVKEFTHVYVVDILFRSQIKLNHFSINNTCMCHLRYLKLMAHLDINFVLLMMKTLHCIL